MIDLAVPYSSLQSIAATIRWAEEPFSELVISGVVSPLEALRHLRSHLENTRADCPVLINLERAQLIMDEEDWRALENMIYNGVTWRLGIVFATGTPRDFVERISASCKRLPNIGVFRQYAPAAEWLWDCAPSHCIPP
jgi:hypothetical protein